MHLKNMCTLGTCAFKERAHLRNVPFEIAVDRLDASRFQAPGINYKGKLIGVEDVPGPRGDKMCHVAMAKLKAAVKTIGEHKLKIVVNISLDGVRIVEEKSEVGG